MDMSMIPLDYATLRLIWWALLGLLLIGFAVMDGFDLGVATLLPAVARTDGERRLVLNVRRCASHVQRPRTAATPGTCARGWSARRTLATRKWTAASQSPTPPANGKAGAPP